MTFKDVAYKILKEAGKALHSDEITERARKKGWLNTAGKTPNYTMNAQLLTDINSGGEKGSRFKKTAPSTFGLNANYVKSRKTKTKNISSTQKGDIAEARVAELIVLYGEKTLSCYKPISDDDGIDLIVKEKGSFKTMYIQVKSRFVAGSSQPTVVLPKSILDNHSMALVSCSFDTEKGDMSDYLWFVPAPEIKRAERHKKASNAWDDYLINKRELANKIIEQMKRL